MNAAGRYFLSTFMLLIAGAALADENADRAKVNKAELDKLQGRWKVVSLVLRGQDQDEVVKLGLVFTFKDDALTVTADANDFTTQNKLLRLEANATPKLLDVAETAKQFEEHKEVVEGVYTLDGDTMQWCFNLDGDQPAKANRPAAVESKPDSSTMLIKLERVNN
ncbi:MAG TPA: TIGR03067 domain-containing protein [Pirellulales bacterium]|jgi:uncharacterized protein (TIGR03067 family)|nr:TIGR03067 domain-containing protein [Pirellulales bacterium]